MKKDNHAKLATYLAGAGAAGLANLPTDVVAEVLYRDFKPDVKLRGGFSSNRIKVTINPRTGLSASVSASDTVFPESDAISLFPASYRTRVGASQPTASAGSLESGYSSGKNPAAQVYLVPGLSEGSTVGGSAASLRKTAALEGRNYLGFQYSLPNGGGSHYGWIRYKYTAPSDPASPLDSEITLLEGALESTPGKRITIPRSVAILALGTVGREADRLAIRWRSNPGMIYHLKSTTNPAAHPSSWEAVEVDGKLNIPATPPANTHTIERPDDPTRFYRVEEFPAPPKTVFHDDLESGQGDWTTGSDGAPGSEWELGAPTEVGPSQANSGSHCFGTNLAGRYAFNSDVWLRSPAVDLAGARGATLSYAQVTDIEEGFDHWKVRVLNAADDSLIAEVSDSKLPISRSWESVSHELPAAALGKRIKIEFRFTSDHIQNYAGWYIDDVKVIVKP